MKKVMLIFGTRPEAIKMCPLALELERRPAFETVVCVTGQHRQMLDQILSCFHVQPRYDLSIMREKQTLFDVTINILDRLRAILETERPDVVMVHGDTSTAFATALACFYMQIPVGHVEAGLRTYDLYAPFPEEFNRQAVDLLARFYFAPTGLSRQNLLREGKPDSRIFVTGNTVIDALDTTVRPDYTHPETEWAHGSRLILLTAHRRENIGPPMRSMFTAIRRIVDDTPDVKVIYPMHMNPAVRDMARECFAGQDRIHMIEPMDVLDFHNLMARAYLILTDSGGIQEEAPALGKPVLVMRDTTERPEGVEAGTLKLVGTEEASVYAAVHQLLTDEAAYLSMARSVNPYGDGNASRRIADILACQL
ncbi:MAG: UDP-N-acetylglucosamine 2-epimerase (non-hydrolyzing) [Clostridia bacterium]|nr:UDP-N-acetylglucosamine 2-epimerase (non-hydrolyzing) [Clostridia bacterium]